MFMPSKLQIQIKGTELLRIPLKQHRDNNRAIIHNSNNDYSCIHNFT